jgi:hypothetical protein
MMKGVWTLELGLGLIGLIMNAGRRLCRKECPGGIYANPFPGKQSHWLNNSHTEPR